MIERRSSPRIEPQPFGMLWRDIKGFAWASLVLLGSGVFFFVALVLMAVLA